MFAIQGKGASSGVAYGKLYFYKRAERRIEKVSAIGQMAERARFAKAQVEAENQLEALRRKALADAGEEAAQLFEIHAMMLFDADYTDIVGDALANGDTAEAAVSTAMETMSGMFSAMDDAYIRARAADVRDISERLLNILTGSRDGEISSDSPVIIVADDLAPSETVQLDKSKVAGFLTFGGSTQGHTAILARTLCIPAVIGAGEISESNDGRTAYIDGDTGEIYIDADELTANKMKQRIETFEARRTLLEEYKGKPNITLDGKEIRLYCNISGEKDIAAAERNDASGIGLYRTEFLYLGTDDFPTEDEQFEAYRSVASAMNGKPVIIRTLDIGADKQVGYFGLEKEENPAMGVRAVRICLTRPEVFRTQLRAIFRAAAYGKICIMIPMICSMWEIREVKRVMAGVAKELQKSGIAYGEDIELGVMIETPAAVMISDQLAREVDFFSVGTNDLTQYTLACDRQNSNLGRFYDPHHKAVLRMIKIAADNAHAAGIWIGICGELASDTTLTELFLRMGIDELSVTAGNILPLRKKISEIDLSKSSTLTAII